MTSELSEHNWLLEKITMSKLEDRFLKMLTLLVKNDMIILNDFVLQCMPILG
jgi:hypothetical protein